ncbi:uncharacterized protein LOC125203335 [Salvia hispanica]|uniref:uncharacterized protein LOC125203335 n=1 Tax=Salvia hispanica TaxID=49212 RepID=UPI002009B6D9|nr:uncharacterized protein LOC125203335 [Salvia hispanica]XP_047957720.1 uncharacterized protein LOC125203335 [Salvia hispanica]
MEELGEITKAHYRAGSQRVKDLAYDFFKSMDTDGDDQVDRSEFLAFMRQQGCYPYMQNPSFFNKLDVDGSGTLEFFEVMTLYYIMKSGRPFCDMCGQFITGIFFSCVQCFKNPQTSYNLCLDCYSGEKKCNHTHNGRSQFLDNFVFLQAMRDPKLAHALEVNFNEVGNRPTNAIVPLQHDSTVHIQNANNVPGPSNSKWSKVKLAFDAFEASINVGILSNALGLCTIM